MSIDLLTKTYILTAATAAYRFVKGTATDGELAQSTAASDKTVGVTRKATVAAKARCDVGLQGEHLLEFGGAVAGGDFLRPDANGKGVVATTGQRFGAMALESGGDGTIGAVLVCHGFVP